MRILDRYLLREWAKVFGLCLLGFGGLILISHCYNRIPDMERWGLSFGTSVEYLALLMIGSIPMLLPISLLISVIFTLGALNRNQELAAIRAAGVGLWRLTAPLWAAGAACALLLVALNAYWINYLVLSTDVDLEANALLTGEHEAIDLPDIDDNTIYVDTVEVSIEIDPHARVVVDPNALY